MLKTRALILSIAFLLAATSAFADEAPPDVPTELPNPFRQAIRTPVSITDDLKVLEEAVYGESNEKKPEESRLGALERTIFGASYANKFSAKTRAQGLTNIVSHLLGSRNYFDKKQWKECKDECNEVLTLLGKEYKSLVRAEVHYRIGMCDYELSNVRYMDQPDSKVRPSGQLIKTSQENLTRAQEYYKSLGQPERAEEIAKFIQTFKEKSKTYFLY